MRFTPRRSLQSNGMTEISVKARKSDCASTVILRDAGTILILLLNGSTITMNFTRTARASIAEHKSFLRLSA